MTHQYPANEILGHVTEARVNALSGFGFTQWQREFLVTVMVHSAPAEPPGLSAAWLRAVRDVQAALEGAFR